MRTQNAWMSSVTFLDHWLLILAPSEHSGVQYFECSSIMDCRVPYLLHFLPFGVIGHGSYPGTLALGRSSAHGTPPFPFRLQ